MIYFSHSNNTTKNNDRESSDRYTFNTSKIFRYKIEIIERNETNNQFFNEISKFQFQKQQQQTLQKPQHQENLNHEVHP